MRRLGLDEMIAARLTYVQMLNYDQAQKLKALLPPLSG